MPPTPRAASREFEGSGAGCLAGLQPLAVVVGAPRRRAASAVGAPPQQPAGHGRAADAGRRPAPTSSYVHLVDAAPTPSAASAASARTGPRVRRAAAGDAGQPVMQGMGTACARAGPPVGVGQYLHSHWAPDHLLLAEDGGAPAGVQGVPASAGGRRRTARWRSGTFAPPPGARAGRGRADAIRRAAASSVGAAADARAACRRARCSASAAVAADGARCRRPCRTRRAACCSAGATPSRRNRRCRSTWKVAGAPFPTAPFPPAAPQPFSALSLEQQVSIQRAG